jgi:hypothetical protein
MTALSLFLQHTLRGTVSEQKTLILLRAEIVPLFSARRPAKPARALCSWLGG